MNTVSITSNYNFESGYKQILKTLLDGLPEFNYFVQPKSCSRISDDFKQYFLNDNTVSSSKVDLCLLSIVDEINNINPILYLNFNKPRILYTMWETTRMNDLLIEILNNFKCIIVPNYYNKENLVKQGCTTRIEVVELFCDTNHFIYSKHVDKDFFVFGTANEDPRKNLNRVTNCFLKAFKNKSSVKLQIKTCNGNVTKFVGNNILHLNKKYTTNELRDWYYNLDVYVSGATCEGWGMMQQESMCCGRPIIYTHYGGLKEFVNENNAFQVKYDEVFAKGNWGHSVGKWSEFVEEDMIEKMIYCYSNKDEVYHKGYLAFKSASQFTKERFLKKINTIISEYI